jgi:hypothetical protein
MVANKFKNQNPTQPMGRCSMHPITPRIYLFWKRIREGWVGCECFFSILSHKWFFWVSWHTFVLVEFARWLWGSKCSSILFTYMGEPHRENIRNKLLFWFSLQGGCEGPKRVLFFCITWVGHMYKTLEINSSFGLLEPRVNFHIDKRNNYLFYRKNWNYINFDHLLL